jgi:hypothetical protein
MARVIEFCGSRLRRQNIEHRKSGGKTAALQKLREI